MNEYVYNDGGRAVAGHRGRSGDCAVRAMAIACELPYEEARARCADAAQAGRKGSRAIARGLYREDFEAALSLLGWTWRSAPKIAGRKARAHDMPQGRVIVRMARHYAAVVDGVLYDSWNSTPKMVYGYWAPDND